MAKEEKTTLRAKSDWRGYPKTDSIIAFRENKKGKTLIAVRGDEKKKACVHVEIYVETKRKAYQVGDRVRKDGKVGVVVGVIFERGHKKILIMYAKTYDNDSLHPTRAKMTPIEIK